MTGPDRKCQAAIAKKCDGRCPWRDSSECYPCDYGVSNSTLGSYYSSTVVISHILASHYAVPRAIERRYWFELVVEMIGPAGPHALLLISLRRKRGAYTPSLKAWSLARKSLRKAEQKPLVLMLFRAKHAEKLSDGPWSSQLNFDHDGVLSECYVE